MVHEVEDSQGFKGVPELLFYLKLAKLIASNLD